MYNIKAKNMNKKIKSLYDEIDKLKLKLNNNAEIDESEEKLYECVREVLKYNINPYQIWKAFSDIKGENFFLDILLNQK